jgi:hypothetical protein
MCVRSNGVRDAERGLGTAISEIRGLFTVDSGWGGSVTPHPCCRGLPITRPRTGAGGPFILYSRAALPLGPPLRGPVV